MVVLQLCVSQLFLSLRLPYPNVAAALPIVPAIGIVLPNALPTVDMILLLLRKSLAFERALPIDEKKPPPRLSRGLPRLLLP